MGINSSVVSLNNYYGHSKLKNLSITWINNYNPWFSDVDLLSSFEKVFDEDATLFEMHHNIKRIVESLSSIYYHNEAYVKSFLIERFGKNDNVSFFELPVNNSRIDLCSINGHSVAYELKTKYDSLTRLQKQLDDYLKAFEYVYVVCSNEKTNKVLDIIPDCVGVYEYDDSKQNIKFILIKKATISNYLNRETQINILRKGEIPLGAELLSDDEINRLFKNTLKTRYKNKWIKFIDERANISRLDYQYYFKCL